MKEKGAVDIQLHAFLNSTLLFHSEKSPFNLLNGGWVRNITGLASVGERYYCFCRELNPDCLVVQPAA